jgi:hypothetical protein
VHTNAYRDFASPSRGWKAAACDHLSGRRFYLKIPDQIRLGAKKPQTGAG